MTKIKGIVRLECCGITAKVKDKGKHYTTYQEFAEEVGYPRAAYDYCLEKSEELDERIDEEFDVLVKGKHGSNGRDLYVIESNDGTQFIFEGGGLEFNGKESESTSLTTRKQAEELLAEIRRQAYAEGYEQAKKDAEKDAEIDKVWGDITNPPKPLAESPQQKRDRIVEQAKDDLIDIENRMISGVANNEGSNVFRHGKTEVDFVVNKEKRTVVALVKGIYMRGILAKGIAKCSPGDCFNAHIGKVIALRRALELEVPDEYLNAPQPTEVREGDVIRLKSGQTRTISHISTAHMNYTSGKCNSLDLVSKGYAEIIDDSESIAP